MRIQHKKRTPSIGDTKMRVKFAWFPVKTQTCWVWLGYFTRFYIWESYIAAIPRGNFTEKVEKYRWKVLRNE